MTATKAAGKTVATQTPTGLAVVSAFQELVTIIPIAEDGDGLDIIARILTADSVEALAEDDGLPSSKDLAPFAPYVEKVTRRLSDHPSSTGFYVIVDGVTPDGEPIRFSAGGESSVAVLAKLVQLGALPIQVQFEKITTKSGREAINARPIPDSKPTNKRR